MSSNNATLSKTLGRIAGILLVLALLWPFLYAVWVSFAPGELLEPPMGQWSLRWYREFLGSSRWLSALSNSLQIAGLSIAGSLVGGLGLAIAIARFRFLGRRMLSVVVLLPVFVPGVVLAIGELPVVMRLGLRGTPLGIAAAHCLIALPVVYLLLRNTIERTDPLLEQAARGLGASYGYTLRRITVPLVAPAILAGAAIAFILSINEFILAVFLSTPRVRTLPAALWPAARDKETPLLAAASCVMVLVTFVGMAIAARLLRWRASAFSDRYRGEAAIDHDVLAGHKT